MNEDRVSVDLFIEGYEGFWIVVDRINIFVVIDPNRDDEE